MPSNPVSAATKDMSDREYIAVQDTLIAALQSQVLALREALNIMVVNFDAVIEAEGIDWSSYDEGDQYLVSQAVKALAATDNGGTV